MKKNVVVIGTGYWGKYLVRNFHEIGALSGICDIDEIKLKVLKDKYHDIRIYKDCTEVFKDPNVTAVAIAAPAVWSSEKRLSSRRVR